MGAKYFYSIKDWKHFTIALIGIFISTGNQINFSLNPAGMGFGSIITGIGIALVAVNWTVGGWEYVTFTAGEIKNPKGISL